MITLTTAEIKDLAEFAGLTLHPDLVLDNAELESEITIEICPASGILDDDNKPTFSNFVAHCTDYREEGYVHLGEMKPAPTGGPQT